MKGHDDFKDEKVESFHCRTCNEENVYHCNQPEEERENILKKFNAVLVQCRSCHTIQGATADDLGGNNNE